jgi:hypothetical protein
VPEEPRTEVLRRRIELYLHCIGELKTAQSSEFVHQIAEAEDELLMLTESTYRPCRYRTRKPISSPGQS